MTRASYVPSRKRRTREHVIADLGVNHVERQALLCGFSVERRLHDYGIDLEIYTFDKRGAVENGCMMVQVKATDHLRLVNDGREVVCRVESADVRAWLGEFLPVLLVLYDAVGDTAYWVDVSDYFANAQHQVRSASERVTIRLPNNQVVTPDAVRAWSRLLAQRFEPSWVRRIFRHDH